MTGGYTPSDMPRPAGTGAPAVRGYEILGELGRGGMGVVYQARQVGLDRLVALKMILAGAHARKKDLDRFRAEAQAVARFQHPNIVQIYEVGEADGLPYFSLEFVDGGTLAGKIHREPQPPRFAAETIEALARAMQYAHDRGVVHRDLKPANVLLSADGTPKVTDFGLAKRLEQDSGQTQAGTVLGTPSYMAPEQAMGQVDQVGPPADVYALGAMLYDLLTGRPPFTGSSTLDTLEMVRTREPVPPGQLTAKLPRDLETICLKCLQKESGKRYPSAGELADDLRRYLEGKPILARPVGAAERAWRWAKRNPWVARLGSATAVSILAVAVVSSLLSYRLNEKKKEAEANLVAAKLAEEREAKEKQEAIIARDAENTAKKEAEANFKAAKAAEAREAKEKQEAILARDAKSRARKTVGEQRALAFDIARGITFDVDAELGTKASLAPIRLRIQRKILADIDKIRDHAEKNPLADRGEAGPTMRIGDIYYQANRVQDAGKQYQKVRAMFQQFVKDYPADPIGPRNLAAATNKLADTRLRLGDAAGTRDLYAEALRHRLKWREMVSGHPSATESVAQSCDLLGRIYLELGDPAEALKNFRASQAEYAKLPKQSLSNLNTRRDLIEIQDRVAECLFKLGQTEKAEAEHKAAYADRERLAKVNPRIPQLTRDLAFSRMSAGDFYLFHGNDPFRAVAEYAPGYKEFSKHARADADDLVARQEVSTMAYRMGYVTDRLADRFPAAGAVLRLTARSFYQECRDARTVLAAADTRDTRGRIDLMIAQARLGQVAEVENLAAGLLKDAGADRRVLFQTACGYAILAGGPGPHSDRCRDAAFRVLGDLVKHGWKDRVALETDPDLEAVRGDKRLADLIAGIPK